MVALAGASLLATACGGWTRGGDSALPSSTTAEGAPASAPYSAEKGGADTSARPAVGADARNSAAAGSGTDAQPGNAAPLLSSDRKIVQNAFLTLTFKDVQSGVERISLIAEANGGLVAESNVRQEANERRATVTIRVPASRYTETLAQVRGLATKVEGERSTANDVSEEFTDLQSRQRNLEAAEQQLLVFLGQAKNVQEVLAVQDRLTTTRAEIERVKGRINLLSRLTDLATIQISLQPERASLTNRIDAPGPLAAMQRGWDASLDVLREGSAVVLTGVAFSWWLLPLAALGVWLGRRIRRRPGPAVAEVPQG